MIYYHSYPKARQEAIHLATNRFPECHSPKDICFDEFIDGTQRCYDLSEGGGETLAWITEIKTEESKERKFMKFLASV